MTGLDAARERLVVALDRPDAASAMQLVDLLSGQIRWCKVGLELFLAAGPGIIDQLLRRELRVFLDLKLHDIPNTVAAAVRSVAPLGASLLTIHAVGGSAMLRAAAEAAASVSGAPRLLGVTVLTSMSQDGLRETGVDSATEEQVLRLGGMAIAAGLDGLVASPMELEALRREFGPMPLLVTPGIRPAAASLDDQSRTATPASALEAGASLLVVGRPITAAADPAEAAEAILVEMGGTK